MALTSAQYATLKAAILADPVLNAYPNTSDGNFDLCAQKLNVAASPAFVVWRHNVTVTETGQVFNGVEWAGMSSLNHTRLQTRWWHSWKEYGVLNDSRYAEHFAARRAQSGAFGKQRVLTDLMRNKGAGSLAQKAVSGGRDGIFMCEQDLM